MITLIIPGKLPEEKKIRATCNRCSAVFDFQTEDAFDIHFRFSTIESRVKCPFCNHLTTHTERHR